VINNYEIVGIIKNNINSKYMKQFLDIDKERELEKKKKD
jgi:hypothetical protein